jgi:hypothetical protein
VCSWAQALLAEQKQAEKRGFRIKAKTPFPALTLAFIQTGSTKAVAMPNSSV